MMLSWVCRLAFAYEILTPAALNFFVTYAEGAVESLWSIDQYFEFVLVLLLSTGLAFQVQCSLPCSHSQPLQHAAASHWSSEMSGARHICNETCRTLHLYILQSPNSSVAEPWLSASPCISSVQLFGRVDKISLHAEHGWMGGS